MTMQDKMAKIDVQAMVDAFVKDIVANSADVDCSISAECSTAVIIDAAMKKYPIKPINRKRWRW